MALPKIMDKINESGDFQCGGVILKNFPGIVNNDAIPHGLAICPGTTSTNRNLNTKSPSSNDIIPTDLYDKLLNAISESEERIKSTLTNANSKPKTSTRRKDTKKKRKNGRAKTKKQRSK